MQKNGNIKLRTKIYIVNSQRAVTYGITKRLLGACRTKLLESVTLYSFIGLAAKVILFSVKVFVAHGNI